VVVLRRCIEVVSLGLGDWWVGWMVEVARNVIAGQSVERRDVYAELVRRRNVGVRPLRVYKVRYMLYKTKTERLSSCYIF